jgi:hypothetical protein
MLYVQKICKQTSKLKDEQMPLTLLPLKKGTKEYIFHYAKSSIPEILHFIPSQQNESE